MLEVFIPTLGRAGQVRSLRWLPPDREIVLVTTPAEMQAYAEAHVADRNIRVLAHPAEYRGHMGKVRRWIMDVAARGRQHFQVDDDIDVRLIGAPSHEEMLLEIEEHMSNGAVMAGLGQQFMCNAAMTSAGSHHSVRGHTSKILRNKFVATVYAIDPRRMEGCPLDNLPVYEDVALCIHAIQQGGTLITYAATHTNKSPAEGGCNSWRDRETTLRSLDSLCELYPAWCGQVPTKNTTHSQQIGVGLRTAWSKIPCPIQPSE